ncbi:MAG: glycosyltransferase [Rubrivivax sp.]|nr:glycosyltransferase [Rubrivivax sp.]
MGQVTSRRVPLRLRIRWAAGALPQWGLNWLRKLATVEGLTVQPTAGSRPMPLEADAPELAQDALDVDLWPGTVSDALNDGPARCEWAIVDPDGTPILEAARGLHRAAAGAGWELLLLEREGPGTAWCLRRRAHVACPPGIEAAHQALADAAVRLVRQGAADRSLGLPSVAVPPGFAARLGKPGARAPAPHKFASLTERLKAWWARQRSRLVSEYWCIGVIDAPVHEVLTRERLEVRWITKPQASGYWADPFGVPGDPDKLACEYFDERTGKGSIELLTLEADGGIRFRERLDVGQREHASFPASFEMDGRRFGLAETAALRKLTLHEVDAQGYWSPLADLLTDVAAADPVLFKAEGRYWLAYTDVDLGALDNLCLMHAEQLQGPWQPHANNPVKVDVRGARMAGRPFEHEGRLYRPAQDCLLRYGHAVVLHRIEHLSPERFEETVVRRLEPDPKARLAHGLHTLSAWGERTLVDAKIERVNVVTWMRKLRDRLGLPLRGGYGRAPHDDRVFIYVPHLRTGGGEISMLRVAEGLSERGLDVELVVHDASTRELPLPRGLTLIDLQANGTAQAIRRLAQRIRKRSPRWVISAFPHTNIATVTAVKMARNGAMSVITEHAPLSHQIEQQDNWRYRALPLLVRAAYRRADAIVAVSQGVREDLKPMVGRRVRIHCIHNPVLPDNFEEASELEPEHPWLNDPGLQVIMSLCRLSEEKDLPTLLRAFARIRHSHPCARLLMVGEGPERERLQALVEELQLQGLVELPGRTTEPLSWLRKAAVFVLASRFEGYGNVLVEALAVGTPVVSTDCPVGPREILDNGRFGDLVPVADDVAMGRAIGRALTARALPEGAKAAARKRTQARACDEYLALLNHLDLSRGDVC